MNACKIKKPCQLCYSLIVCLFFGQTDGSGQQAELIVAPPEAAANLDGNSFFRPFDTSASGRFQQVYDSSVFSSLPSGGGSIVALVFREDATVGHGFLATITNIQINLSTTSRSSDGLSTVFADNAGIDDTAVLGPRSVLIAGAGGGGVTVFSVSFVFLDHPFYFNPANGNLLVDFRIYTGLGTLPQGIANLDAFNTIGDSVSSVFAYSSGGLPTMGQTSSLGLTTAFSIIPVPEPSSLVLLVAGLGVLGLAQSRMSKRKVYLKWP